jgi:hypothetical protein
VKMKGNLLVSPGCFSSSFNLEESVIFQLQLKKTLCFNWVAVAFFVMVEKYFLTCYCIFSFLPGWVREVIYAQEPDGSYTPDTPPEIIYHAPVPPGTKPRQFKNLSEMSGYLTNKASTLTWHNFSFRKEVMGAVKGQEVVRGKNDKVQIFPEEKSTADQGNTSHNMAMMGEKSKANNKASSVKCKFGKKEKFKFSQK